MSDPSAPSNPYGEPASPYGQPVAQPPQQYGYAPGYPPVDPTADERPGTVTAACVLTLVLSGLTAMLVVLAMVGLTVNKDQIIHDLRDQQGLENVSADDFFVGLIVVLVVFLVWCLSAILLAILALRRHNWARVMLIVSSAMAALFSLLAILSAVSAVTLICAVAAMVMLLSRGARDWFARKNQLPQMPLGTTQPWG